MAIPSQVSEEGHSLKVFQGITVSISKMMPKEKTRFSQLIKKHGGTYSPELTKMCTHLVVMNRPGKVRDVSQKERYNLNQSPPPLLHEPLQFCNLPR